MMSASLDGGDRRVDLESLSDRHTSLGAHVVHVVVTQTVMIFTE